MPRAGCIRNRHHSLQRFSALDAGIGPANQPLVPTGLSSDRVTELGDILAVDCDMIGPYGYCADLSRTWTIGHTAKTGSPIRIGIQWPN